MHAARIRTPNRTLILLCFDELVRVFSMSEREFGAQSILNLACKLLMHLRNFSGAPGRTRTSTMLPPTDFESAASTNSATGAYGPDHSGDLRRVNLRARRLRRRRQGVNRDMDARLQQPPRSKRGSTGARSQPIAAAAAVVALGGAATILGAWFFQYCSAPAVPALPGAALPVLFRDPARGVGHPRRNGRQPPARPAWRRSR